MKHTAAMVFTGASIWALLYMQFVLDTDGAGRILIAATWFFLFISFFCFAEDIQKKLRARTPRNKWLTALDRLSDFGITLVLFWHGWWWTGAAFGTHLFLTVGAVQKAEADAANTAVSRPQQKD